jgi:hypothetical protein
MICSINFKTYIFFRVHLISTKDTFLILTIVQTIPDAAINPSKQTVVSILHSTNSCKTALMANKTPEDNNGWIEVRRSKARSTKKVSNIYPRHASIYQGEN